MAIKSGYNSKDYEKKSFTFNDKEEIAGMYKVTYTSTKDMDLVPKGNVVVTSVIEPDSEPEVTTTPVAVESVPEVKKTTSTPVVEKSVDVSKPKTETKPVKKTPVKQVQKEEDSDAGVETVQVKTTTKVVKETLVNQKKQVFEYMVEDIEYKNSKELTKTLNTYGADSWELVDFDVIQRVFNPAQARCVFKRVKK